MVLEENRIYDPYKARYEYVNEAFAQDRKERDAPVVDGLGWVLFLEEGNGDTVFP